MRILDANSYELMGQEAERRRRNWKRQLKSKQRTKKGREEVRIKSNTDKRTVAKRYAGELTERATEAERMMYRVLKETGINFIFQHPIYNKDKDGTIRQFFIADFYLPDSGTVIEVDGGYHYDRRQVAKDTERTGAIRHWHRNMKVMRISNRDVMDAMKVMGFIKRIQDREKSKKET